MCRHGCPLGGRLTEASRPIRPLRNIRSRSCEATWVQCLAQGHNDRPTTNISVIGFYLLRFWQRQKESKVWFICGGSTRVVSLLPPHHGWMVLFVQVAAQLLHLSVNLQEIDSDSQRLCLPEIITGCWSFKGFNVLST